MSSLVLLFALSCSETKMVNTTEYQWNEHDMKTLAYCKNRCKQIYKDSPCVKLFKKWGKQDYSVICGAPE